MCDDNVVLQCTPHCAIRVKQIFHISIAMISHKFIEPNNVMLFYTAVDIFSYILCVRSFVRSNCEQI